MVALLASTAFSTRVSRYAFRSSNVSDIFWVKEAVVRIVLLVMRYAVGQNESPSCLHHTKSLRFALCPFRRLVKASQTAIFTLLAEICGRLLHRGVSCVKRVFSLFV